MLVLPTLALLMMSGMPDALAADLQWGRASSNNPLRHASTDATNLQFQRSEVVTAAWEADDELAAGLEDNLSEGLSEPMSAPREELTEPEDEPAENLLPTVDPFEAEDRVAQLVNDPFDEPAEGPLPSMDSELDEIDKAIQQEQERREQQSGEQSEQPFEDRGRGTEELPSGETPEGAQIESGPSQRNDLDFDLNLSQSRQSLDNQQRAEEMELNRKNCEDELAMIKSDRISSVDVTIELEGIAGEDFPFECSLGDERLQPRMWPEITYTWKASALCHKPLYFEQNQLERYGHSWGPYLQPVMSGVHFFTSAPLLPYKMGIEPPNECIYALGHYRPGSCAPYIIEAIPFTWRAAFYEGGVITGISFVIP